MLPRHLTFAAFFIAGCSMPTLPTLPGLTPYKMDIQQGNVVTQEMIAKVQPGMTRSQVRFALGTPLIVDPFHTDRWDYVYSLQKAGVLTEQRRFAVIFKDDRLVRIEGDVVPASTVTKSVATKLDKPAPGAEKQQEEKPKQEKPQEQRGFFGRMLDWLGF